MIADGTIVDADINANAEIAVSKLQDGTARQLLQTAANGTDVEWASNIDIPGTLDVTGNAVFDANLTVQGDLTVNGTETIINTQTLTVEDKNIELGKITSPTDATADGGGITLKGTTDKTINWIDATDAWTLSEHVDLATGKEYRINGAQVLTGTALGSGVTSSSLTSVGTISSGTWQGTTVGTAYGGTGQTTYTNGELLIGKTDGTLAKATLTAGTGVAVTNADGSITVAVDSTVVTTAQTGTVTSTMIADGTIVDADVNASAAIAGTKISPDFGSQNVVTTGTSTAASLIPTGSSVPTNGVYLPAANSVGISTNGVNRFHIASNGRVGVGTASPATDLHIVSGDPELRMTDSDGTNQIGRFRESNGIVILSSQNSTSNGGYRFQQFDGTTTTTPLTIDSAGRVGIGTTSPSYLTEIVGGTDTQETTVLALRSAFTGANTSTTLRLSNSAASTGGAGIAEITAIRTNSPSNGATDLVIKTSSGTVSNERARIDSSGRLLVGDTASQTVLEAHTAQVSHATGLSASFIRYATAAVSSSVISIGRSKSATIGTQTTVANNDALGQIRFVGTDGVVYRRAAEITGSVDGVLGQTAGTFVVGTEYRILTTGTTDFTLIGAADSDPGTIFTATDVGTGTGTAIRTAGDMPGRLVFSTTPDNTGAPVERARITNTGALLVGTAATPTGAGSGAVVAQDRVVISSTQAGRNQIICGATGIVTATTGTVVFKFKVTVSGTARACYAKVSLAQRGTTNTPSDSPAAEYGFQLFSTSTGDCSLNGAATLFEYTYDRATHFAFADLGSGECTVTLTNPTIRSLSGSYKVEILAWDGFWTFDSVTTT
jgi:hypothetical protein